MCLLLWTITLPGFIALLLLGATLPEWRTPHGSLLSALRATIAFLGLHLLGSIGGPPAMIAVTCCLLVPVAYLLTPEVWVTARQEGLREPGEQDSELLIHVGREAICVAPLRPQGRIRIDGELREAVSENGYVDAGSTVVITGVRDNRLVVAYRSRPVTVAQQLDL